MKIQAKRPTLRAASGLRLSSITARAGGSRFTINARALGGFRGVAYPVNARVSF